MQRVSCSSLVSKAVNLSAQPVLAAAASACNSQEVNQSINQFTTHSMNQPINQRRKQSINQAMDQVISSCAELVLIMIFSMSATGAHPLPACKAVVGSMSPGGKGNPEPTPFSCLETDLNLGSPNSQLVMATLSPAFKSDA